MKPLNKYLNPKSKWKPNDDGFPTIEDKKLIIDFLVSKGFICLDKKYDTVNQMYYDASRTNTPFYILGDYDKKNISSFWIRFSNGGTITRENPLFCIRTFEETDLIECYEADYGKNDGYTNFRDMKTFVETVNSHFNWK